MRRHRPSFRRWWKVSQQAETWERLHWLQGHTLVIVPISYLLQGLNQRTAFTVSGCVWSPTLLIARPLYPWPLRSLTPPLALRFQIFFWKIENLLENRWNCLKIKRKKIKWRPTLVILDLSRIYSSKFAIFFFFFFYSLFYCVWLFFFFFLFFSISTAWSWRERVSKEESMSPSRRFQSACLR